MCLRYSTLLPALVALAGCGGGESGPIELLGTWDNAFGSDEVISATKWNSATIVEVDNTANVAITQSPADDMFTANKFSRVVWTEIAEDSFHYCITDFGKDSADAARSSVIVPDASAPDEKGCGGFSWTRAFKPIEVHGTFRSSFGGMETVTSTAWSGLAIRRFSNETNYAVVQSPPSDPFTPNKYSKLVWTEPSASGFWYCTVDFGKDTLAGALTSTKTADASSPDMTGCGGFSWTHLEL